MSDTPYFTVDEFRARYPDLTSSLYPDATVEQYRVLAEQAFEDACQRAFVPRQATDTIYDTQPASWPWYSSESGVPRKLEHPDVRSVLSASDSAGSVIDISNVEIVDGWVHALNAAGTVTVTYEYGLDTPPLRVKQAVMSLTREWMVSGPVTDRQTGIPTEGGGSISLALPGGRFGTFGLPEVDATVDLYGAGQVFVA